MSQEWSDVDWDRHSIDGVLQALGFFPYSGADGDLFRKQGVAGWRVSVHGRHLVRIQKKGRPFKGRNTWNTKREWHTEPHAADRHLQALGELPPEAIEDFEAELTTLVENGELSDEPEEYEDYVYQPAGSGAFEVEPIIRDAVDEFTEMRPPNDAVEINSGYTNEFVDHLQDNYDLPDGVEFPSTFWVHQWIKYEGEHFDAEYPYGVDDANELAVWDRVLDETRANAAEESEYIEAG